MGLDVEISGHPSAIVVTLSGTTDLAALRPLQAALSAAMADGQTVVVDIDNATHLDIGVLAELLAAAEPAGQLRLVGGGAEVRGGIAALEAAKRIQMYPSVDAALAGRAARSAPPAGQVDGPGTDLPAKFARLSERYLAAIDQCWQLVHRLEDASDSTRSGPLEPDDGALHQNATQRSADRKLA
jgi:anti-anti-sigma regulatory factor